MTNILIVSLAVAFTYALLEPLIDIIHIYVSNKAFNSIFWMGLNTLGLYVMEGLDQKSIIKVLAASFLSRTSLAALERATTYRRTIVKTTD